jgi:galactitol-specific phosphotransferase system IIB component
MARRIAVEDGLTNVVQALRDKGYDVSKMVNGTMSNVDAAVITGMSNNFMGIADTNGNKFPIIVANGMTAQEIVSTIEARLEQIRS